MEASTGGLPTLAIIRAFMATPSSPRGGSRAAVPLLLAGLALLAAPAARAAPYRIGPPPAWVQPVEVPFDVHMPETATQDGLEFLLYDRQVRASASSFYTHIARRYVNEEGVHDSSELTFSFDPSYQTLVLHQIRLHRGGQVIDALKHGRVSVLRREEDLERKMYDGTLSVVVSLVDVRVGDVLEYAYSENGANPVFRGRFHDSVELAWGTPLARLSQRLLWPSERALHVKDHGTVAAPAVTAKGAETEYLWRAEDVPATEAEGTLPFGFDPYAWVQLSEWASWEDVAAWARPLYKVRPFRLAPALRERLSRPTPEESLVAALRFVQDEVRYLGIELGSGSHAPRDPGTVLATRFGDCKDKALLLVHILGALGIEAAPALVNTRERRALAAWDPTPAAFDHVVVRARLSGRTVWVDPTRSHQRGSIDRTFFSDLGLALPVADGAGALEPIPEPDRGLARRHVCERFVIRSFDEPADFLVTTTYEGVRADLMREELSRTSRKELTDSYRKFYVRTFPGAATAAPIAVHDDPLANVLVVAEAYTVPNLWELEKDGTRRASFYPQDLRDHLPAPPDPTRAQPLAIVYPDDLVEEMEIVLPEDWSIRPMNETVVNDGILFRATESYAHRVLTIRYELATLSREVPVSGMARFSQDVRAIIDRKLGEELTWSPPKPAPRRKVEPTGWAALHVPVVGAALLASALLSIGGVALIRRKPSRVVPPPVPAAEPLPFTGVLQPSPEGLGGWLLLVGFGVCVKPLVLVAQMLAPGQTAVFRHRTWELLASPASPNYSPVWAPLLMGELLFNLTLLAASIVLLVAFFARRQIFPRLFIAVLVLNVVFIGLDGAAASLVSGAKGDSGDVGRMMLMAFIWVPYMLRSRRVKATFVR